MGADLWGVRGISKRQNIQHPTSNGASEGRWRVLYWMLGVGCWMLDVFSDVGVRSAPCRFRSAAVTCSNTVSQSPGRDWRNRRSVGYQGVCGASKPHRQSGTNESMIHRWQVQRSHQIRCRGVGGDDQVQFGHQRRAVGKIGDVCAEIQHAGGGEWRWQGIARLDLQAHEGHTRHLEDRLQHCGSHRAAAIIGLRRDCRSRPGPRAGTVVGPSRSRHAARFCSSARRYGVVVVSGSKWRRAKGRLKSGTCKSCAGGVELPRGDELDLRVAHCCKSGMSGPWHSTITRAACDCSSSSGR